MEIPLVTERVPFVDTAQMIEVDRAMIEDYRIELIQMMENAGRNLAHLARIRFLNGDPRGKRIVILAGTGGNGGGALVCARRLHNYGAQVNVYITRPAERFAPIPAHQVDILGRMKVAVAPAGAVTGTGNPDLMRPRGPAADLIRWANAQAAPILALDAPSGVDTTTGTVFDPAIRAIATMTLALPKAGLLAPGVKSQVGELYLADISVPPSLYAEPALGLQVGPLFARSDILRLR